MMYFYDVLNNLDTPKLPKKNTGKDKIPVILSADDNYSCFVGITGASILYNTESFIEFYIISEGISDKNKAKISDTFSHITNHYSIKFLECDSKKMFSSIKLRQNYHVKLNTCNRLLFPLLAPDVDRAIYLDVDLIVMGDIKELWEQELDGHIIGAVPLLIDRPCVVEEMRRRIGAEKTEYKYFNSGILLLDYKKWRQQSNGSNQQIIDDLMALLSSINANVTPDELLLNKHAFINSGYKALAHKFNVNPYYCYQYLLRNKNKLSSYEQDTLKDFEKTLKKYDYWEAAKLEEKPVVRHFFGHEKPWNSVKQTYFPMPITINFEDFWFYAKMTPYFQQIKDDFLMTKMATPLVWEDDPKKKRKYQAKVEKYKILQFLTFGLVKTFSKRKKHYKKKLVS